MARRPCKYSASAIEALFMRKTCASYGLLQSFDRQERSSQLGTANCLSQHGDAMPQIGDRPVSVERRQRAIHLRVFPFHPQYELQRRRCRPHAAIDRRFMRQASSGNLHRQMSSLSPTSPLARHLHARVLIHFGATGGAFIQARSFCTILHYGPVQEPDADNKLELERKKPVAVVVLLGWLGAKHRHLRRYADWYTSNGMHVITFVIPITDVIMWRAEKHVEILSQRLLELQMSDSDCQDQEMFLVFHTFSNTGWMIYGALLELFLQSSEGVRLVKKIKGCVLDSGPAPKNEPRVWAAGLCAAILKKSSVATQAQLKHEHQAPSRMETILIGFCEKLVAGFLQIPYIKRRVDDVTLVLLKKQPLCPQLYLYSNADTVIPATSIESFIAEQKRSGFKVQACNFHTSPHVDHFRSFPVKYKEQLASFVENFQLQHEKANVCAAKS